MTACKTVAGTISNPVVCGRLSGREKKLNYVFGLHKYNSRGWREVVRYCKHLFVACGASGLRQCGRVWISFEFYCCNYLSLGLQFRTDEAQIPAHLSVKVLQIHETLCCPLRLLLFLASTSVGQMAWAPFGYQKVLKGAGGKSTQRPIKSELLQLKTC